ncbi:MAG: hypothetical protein ACREAW_03300 [Nitrososphaera sp.]
MSQKTITFGICLAAAMAMTALAFGVAAPGVAYGLSFDDIKDNDYVNQTNYQDSVQLQSATTLAESIGNVTSGDNSSASGDATAITDQDQSTVQIATNSNNDNDTTSVSNTTGED